MEAKRLDLPDFTVPNHSHLREGLLTEVLGMGGWQQQVVRQMIIAVMSVIHLSNIGNIKLVLSLFL